MPPVPAGPGHTAGRPRGDEGQGAHLPAAAAAADESDDEDEGMGAAGGAQADAEEDEEDEEVDGPDGDIPLDASRAAAKRQRKDGAHAWVGVLLRKGETPGCGVDLPVVTEKNKLDHARAGTSLYAIYVDSVPFPATPPEFQSAVDAYKDHEGACKPNGGRSKRTACGATRAAAEGHSEHCRCRKKGGRFVRNLSFIVNAAAVRSRLPQAMGQLSAMAPSWAVDADAASRGLVKGLLELEKNLRPKRRASGKGAAGGSGRVAGTAAASPAAAAAFAPPRPRADAPAAAADEAGEATRAREAEMAAKVAKIRHNEHERVVDAQRAVIAGTFESPRRSQLLADLDALRSELRARIPVPVGRAPPPSVVQAAELLTRGAPANSYGRKLFNAAFGTA